MPAKTPPAREWIDYPEPASFPSEKARDAYRRAKLKIRKAFIASRPVTTLILSDMGLTTLPPEIGLLPALNQLWLHGNQLTTLPPQIGHVSGLTGLYLNQNQLTALPPEIGWLVALTVLYLNDNQLTALPPEIGQLTALRELWLEGNKLTALPTQIGQLTALMRLYLGGNVLKALPSEIRQLTALRELWLQGNQLTALPPEIGQITGLNMLSLSDNHLLTVSAEIGYCMELGVLDLSHNRLTALPLELRNLTELADFFLHGNPGLGLDAAVLGPTVEEATKQNATPARPKDILDFYFSTRRASRPLDEARVLVVGRGEAGKTSLCRVLTGLGFDPEETETAGIEIGRTAVRCEDGADITLHLWDFAGQEITYALHRFFLAQQALYLLVLDNRAGTAALDAEDWLRTIAAYAGKAPVIVAMTKQDKHPFHLDTEKLRRRWGAKFARMEFVQTDAQSGRGLGELRRVLSQVARAMPEVRQAFPVEYQEVKDRCEAMRVRGDKRLTLEQFRKLCLEHGVKDADGRKAADRADGLARILHNLGVVLHFVDDPRLRENTVLDPQWVTNGVYQLLRAREKAAEEAERRGAGATEAVLTLGAACAALPEESREAVGFLLSLMERFEMIYVLHQPPLLAGEAADDEEAGDEGRTWFMPAVLPEYQPPLTPALASWREPDGSELRLRFTYPLLPEGLVPRFIVRTWPLNEEMPRWRTGCFLREGRAEALISAERLDRTVEITVRGPEEDRVRLGRLVSRHMEAINKDVPEKPRGEILVRVEVGGEREEVWKSIEVLEKDEAKDAKGESTVETSRGTLEVKADKLLTPISGELKRKERNALFEMEVDPDSPEVTKWLHTRAFKVFRLRRNVRTDLMN